MPQVPPATSVTVLPLTVQTADVRDENITGSPEDAVAPTAKGGAPSARLLNAPKVIDCVACAIMMEKLCVAGGLTPLLALITPVKAPAALGVPLEQVFAYGA